ncbi:Molybdopterin synthase sulfur carrier subunit [compost metagenome]
MEIEIISFGKTTEFLAQQRMKVIGVSNTNELIEYLETTYPMLKQMKYKLALNKVIIQQNTNISENDTIAIMPPFSGG